MLHWACRKETASNTDKATTTLTDMTPWWIALILCFASATLGLITAALIEAGLVNPPE